MTEAEKKIREVEIIRLIKTFLDKEKPTDAVLYIRGDAEFNRVTVKVEGDVKLLGQTIIHHIENNAEFKRFMFSVFGSYLSQNPIAAEEFRQGMELMKSSFSVN